MIGLGGPEERIRERLGAYGVGSGKEIAAAAELTGGDWLEAAAIVVVGRRAWLGVATDRGLVMVRRPRLFGRARDRSFSWGDLREVRSGAQQVDLTFGAETLRLRAIVPHAEFVALVEAARRSREGGPAADTVAELRQLARTKLGRFNAFGYEPTIDGLPDRLEGGERVERLAIASHEFTGLLIVTDRRLMLLDVGVRKERMWEVAREGVSAAPDEEDGLRLETPGGPVELRHIHPPERRDELLAVLPRSADG